MATLSGDLQFARPLPRRMFLAELARQKAALAVRLDAPDAPVGCALGSRFVVEAIY
jgi:hypothetical protein